MAVRLSMFDLNLPILTGVILAPDSCRRFSFFSCTRMALEESSRLRALRTSTSPKAVRLARKALAKGWSLRAQAAARARTRESEKHHSNVTWASWRLKSPVTRQFVQNLVTILLGKQSFKYHNRWTYWLLGCLFHRLLSLSTKAIECLHFWLLWGIHRRPVDYPHKGLAMRQVYSLCGMSMPDRSITAMPAMYRWRLSFWAAKCWSNVALPRKNAFTSSCTSKTSVVSGKKNNVWG